ncbi:hypothetical protein [Sorangium sp. So ce406]|uniref:hypothetical protein n=1 Tax=Sorangium sp. So ce406 TaxID=3133311 RepID=UPI003F5C357C
MISIVCGPAPAPVDAEVEEADVEEVEVDGSVVPEEADVAPPVPVVAPLAVPPPAPPDPPSPSSPQATNAATARPQSTKFKLRRKILFFIRYLRMYT